MTQLVEAAEDTTSGVTIAEAAERTGLSVHTLRYYERDELLRVPPQRAGSGHRRYSASDLDWITLITRLRSTGMPIREVRAYTALCRAGGGNEEERLRILLAHRQRVLDQLAEVRDHLGAIDYKINIYSGRVGDLSPGSSAG